MCTNESVLQKARRRYERRRPGSIGNIRAVDWSDLSSSQKRKVPRGCRTDTSSSELSQFFNFWFFNASIGNVCNIIGAIVSIRNEVVIAGNLTAARLLTGLG